MGKVRILDILDKLPDEKVNSESFGELFQIDGIPLWYFVQPLINSAFLPKPFRPLWRIEEGIKKGERPSPLDKLKFDFSAFAMRKGLATNEWIKYRISKRGRNNPDKTAKKDVLILSLTDCISEKNGKPRFLEFEGVTNSLKRYKIRPLLLAGDSFSKNSFSKLNTYGPLIYDYITPEILRESKRLSGDLSRKWKTLNEKSKMRLFEHRGISYWEFFENDMGLLFSKEFLFTLIKYYLTFKELLVKHDIKVAYLTSFTNFYDLSLLGAVYKLDKKVVYSSHGYTRGTVGTWKFLKNVLFAAGGGEHRTDLLRSGVKKEKIVETGFPFLDEIAHYWVEKVSGAKKTVALLTTTVVESKFIVKKKYFKLIHETLAQLKNIDEVGKIVIKLHPGEKYRPEYESIAKSLGMKNVEIVQEPGKASLYSVINDSDLLVGFGSTAVLEGLMFNKDAIHLEMLESRPVFEFKTATFCVKKVDELAEVVLKILADKRARKELKQRREKYLRQAFYKIDGKAHERVAALIASAVRGKTKLAH